MVSAPRGTVRMETQLEATAEDKVAATLTAGHSTAKPGQRVAAPPPQPMELLKVPVALMGMLRQRFPETLESSCAAILNNMSMEGSFIITPAESKEISSVLGVKIQSGRDILGEVRVLKDQISRLSSQEQKQAQPNEEILKRLAALEEMARGK